MTRQISRVLRGAGVAALALALSACGGGAAPAPTTASPSATGSASVRPSPIETEKPQSAANLPTDCATLGTDATREEAVGDMTLQSDGTGFVRPAPAGAELALGCDWIVGEATGMLLLISTAEPTAVDTAVSELPSGGYTCQTSDDFGAQFCTLEGSGTDTEEMIVARENVWIYLSTVNRNGRAFLSEIVQGIFG